jgi:hypothetical protein
VFPETNMSAPEPPQSLDEILKPLSTSGAGAPPPAAVPTNGGSGGGPAVIPEVVGPATVDFDPEDADAGREMIGWARDGSVWLAAKMQKMNPDDTEVEKLKKPTKFFNLSLKRNGEKMAPLGALTKGVRGLVLGTLIEFGRALFLFWKAKPKEEDQPGENLHTAAGVKAAAPPPKKPDPVAPPVKPGSTSVDPASWGIRGEKS